MEQYGGNCLLICETVSRSTQACGFVVASASLATTPSTHSGCSSGANTVRRSCSIHCSAMRAWMSSTTLTCAAARTTPGLSRATVRILWSARCFHAIRRARWAILIPGAAITTSISTAITGAFSRRRNAQKRPGASRIWVVTKTTTTL